MDNNEILATNETYEAAVKVLERQERSLYPDVLKVLAKVMRLNVPSATYMKNIRIRFWFKSILPLLFDDDINIQEAAIDAFTAFIPHLVVSDYESHEDWPVAKAILVDKYADKIGEFRERLNSNWYRIWSVVMNMLNKEILRSAPLINRFLTIVEQGFRSVNMEIRAEAFLSWRALIEIFSRNNELLAPKRIRLVCIPLKASQSKTAVIAVSKFQVWWYLICTIHANLDEFIETIIQPFLVFCFGPINATPLFCTVMQTSSSTTFKEVMPMSVAALISLLGPTCMEADAIMERSMMDHMPQPCEATVKLCKTNYTMIVNLCGEATAIIAKLTMPIEGRKNLCICLWKNLIQHINDLKCSNMYKLMMDNIKALIKIAKLQSISPNVTDGALKSLICDIILEICRNCTIPLNYSDASIGVELRFAAGKELVSLMLQSDFCSPHQIQEVITRFYDLSAMEQFAGYFNVLRWLSSFLVTFRGKSEVRHKIWSTFQSSLFKYMQSQTENLTDADAAFNFLMVPIMINHERFTTYKDEWIRLAESIAVVYGRTSLCESCIKILRTECFNVKELSEIVASLIDLEEYSFKDVKDVPSAVFDHISVVIQTTAEKMKDLNPIAAAVSTYIKRLGGVELLLIYPRLKQIISDLEATVSSIRCDQSLIIDFKNNVKQIIRNSKETQLLIRKCSNDALKRELTELQKESDFVFISSVWKFNPDRLTDSQKDKMKERRSDIPALYNDMSQSQESHSIQAWKPKKLVLPHDDANESMVIEVNSNSTKETVDTEVIEENEEIAPPTGSHNVIITEARSDIATSSNVTAIPPANTTSQADLEPQISLSPASTTSTTSKTSEDQESRRQAKLQAELRKLEMDIVASNEFQEVGKQRLRRTAVQKTLDSNTISSPSHDKHKTVSTRRSMASPKVDGNKPQQRRSVKSNEPQTPPKKNAETTPRKKANKTKPKYIRNENGESSALAITDKAADYSFDSSQALQETPTKNTKHTRSSSLDMQVIDVGSHSMKAKFDDDTESVSSGASPLNTDEYIRRYVRKGKTKKSKKTSLRLDVKKAEDETAKDTTTKTIAPILPSVITSIIAPIVKDDELPIAPIVKGVEPVVAPIIKEVEPTIAPIVKDFEPIVAPIAPIVKDVEPIVAPIIKEVEPTIAPIVKNVVLTTATIVDTVDSEAAISSPDTPDVIEASQEPSMSLISGRRSFKRLSDWKAAQNIQNMDTECLTDAEPPKTISPIPDNSNATQKISEMDTEPNTEPIPVTVLTVLEANTTETNNKALSPTSPIDNDQDHPVSVSPLFCEDVNMTDVDKSVNQSILTSPRIDDIDARNAELLNSTMNISPIPLSSKSSPVVPEQHNILEQLKVSETISRINSSPPTSSGTLLPVPQHRLHSSTPSASIMNPAGSSGSSPCSSRLNVQLKGRGAQLLNMINSRKLGEIITPNRLIGALEATAPHQPSEIISSAASNIIKDVVPINLFPNNEHTIQPASNINAANKDLLTFSKVLPSPMASPSCSILKRKFVAEETDTSDFDTPASKRKRVSFHDPPVSATKQYINHADEHVERTKIASDQIQALMSRSSDSNTTASPCELRLKHILRRKSRADSMVELAKYDRNKSNTTPSITTSLPLELSQLPILPSDTTSRNHTAEDSVDMESLKCSVSNISNITDDMTSGSITFEDKNAVIESVFEEYPIEELLEKYRASGRQFSATATRFLTKELSHLMQQNDRTCSDTLETLCENHSKSFLQHAIQENRGSVVCSCLTPAVIFDYILEESKTNANIRTTALEKFSAIAAHSSHPNDEKSALEWRAALLKVLELAEFEARAGDPEIKIKLTEIINGIYANNDEISDELQHFIISLLSNRKFKPEQVVQFMSVMVNKPNEST